MLVLGGCFCNNFVFGVSTETGQAKYMGLGTAEEDPVKGVPLSHSGGSKASSGARNRKEIRRPLVILSVVLRSECLNLHISSAFSTTEALAQMKNSYIHSTIRI